MKRILFFIFLSSVPINIAAADGSQTEPEQADRNALIREALIQKSLDKARAAAARSNIQVARGHYILASEAAPNDDHPAVKEAQSFKKSYPITTEEIETGQTAVDRLETAMHAATWVSSFFKHS